MAETKCGYDDGNGHTGSEYLAFSGPTLIVNIGFDPDYKPAGAKPPVCGMNNVAALVDTGASTSCIDSSIAMQLNLPIVDRRMISGAHGAREVNIHLAQIYVPALSFTIYGTFAAVDLIAGGQPHYALIGRTFLRNFTMIYEGKTGTVVLRS